MTVKFYCEHCEDNREVIIEPFNSDELNPGTNWGDIVCKICGFVIATITADKPGVYDVVRIKELEAA